jgi:hypothetical protein
MRVAEAIATDPKVSAHVRDLERRAARQERSRQQEQAASDEPASGEDLAAEFERFLREQRDDSGQA